MTKKKSRRSPFGKKLANFFFPGKRHRRASPKHPQRASSPPMYAPSWCHLSSYGSREPEIFHDNPRSEPSSQRETSSASTRMPSGRENKPIALSDVGIPPALRNPSLSSPRAVSFADQSALWRPSNRATSRRSSIRVATPLAAFWPAPEADFHDQAVYEDSPAESNDSLGTQVRIPRSRKRQPSGRQHVPSDTFIPVPSLRQPSLASKWEPEGPARYMTFDKYIDSYRSTSRSCYMPGPSGGEDPRAPEEQVRDELAVHFQVCSRTAGRDEGELKICTIICPEADVIAMVESLAQGDSVERARVHVRDRHGGIGLVKLALERQLVFWVELLLK